VGSSEAGFTVIAIDGPAGAGKSTIARRLSRRIGWAYLDSGAMYRAVTLAALDRGVALEAADEVAALARSLDLVLEPDGGVRLDGADVTARIRAPAIDAGVSTVARLPAVREVMVAHQRRFAERHGRIVAEGRDIGTVVFPDAALKIYLDADAQERARRRMAERGGADDRALEATRAAMAERDRTDSTREVAPLRQAPDATRIDTSGMTLDDVLDAVLSRVRSAIRPQTAG
jgi:cytidylate kinase